MNNKNLKELMLLDAVQDIESFGNKTFVENVKEVEKALARTEPMQYIFNHSHSQFAWKHITLSWLSATRNIRQIMAELARKRDALWEAKWKCIERAQSINDLELEVMKKKEEQAKLVKHIEGAMKDVLVLTNLYDDLCKTYDVKSEEDFEKQENFSHLCRALSQSLREMRQAGRISTGNQEYLEQIGINPSKVFTVFADYLDKEIKTDDWSVGDLHQFIVGLATELAPHAEERMKLMGYRTEMVDEALQQDVDD